MFVRCDACDKAWIDISNVYPDVEKAVCPECGAKANLYGEDDGNGWDAAYVECCICTHRWVSVYPAGTEKLRCPNCNLIVNFECIEI